MTRRRAKWASRVVSVGRKKQSRQQNRWRKDRSVPIGRASSFFHGQLGRQSYEADRRSPPAFSPSDQEIRASPLWMLPSAPRALEPGPLEPWLLEPREPERAAPA